MIAATFHIPMYVIFGVIALVVVITGANVLRASMRLKSIREEIEKLEREEEGRKNRELERTIYEKQQADFKEQKRIELVELLPPRWLAILDECEKVSNVSVRHAYFMAWLRDETYLPMLSPNAVQKLTEKMACNASGYYSEDLQKKIIAQMIPYFKLPKEDPRYKTCTDCGKKLYNSQLCSGCADVRDQKLSASS